jgi:CarboxypepD_reg-like domain
VANKNYHNMKNLLLTLLLLTILQPCFAQITQTIRGTVLDKETKNPIIGASINLGFNSSNLGTQTDTLGVFKLKNVPIGRQILQITYLGYKTQTINDLQLNAAKEIVLTFELEENAIALAAATITANNKAGTINEMVSISGRTFSPKETGRYAGSLNDPARMARNYAGVSGANDQRNDIIIRGNSPLILSNSDFLTGAFPAEYGNATSGAFDLKLRNGNNEKREHTFTFGALGLEFMTEGALSKRKRASYLFSYRYSTLSILSNLGIKFGFASIPYYQDVTLNVNMPTKKSGTFTLFGLAGLSNTVFYDAKRDSSQFSPANKGENVEFGSKIGVLGLKHIYPLKKSAYLKTTLALTYEGNAAHRDSILGATKSVLGIGGFGYHQVRAVLTSLVNKKFNGQHSLQSGFTVEQIYYSTKDSVFKSFDALNRPTFLYKNDFNGNTTLLQAYSQWKYKVNNEITFNTGLHYQFFALNNQSALEPRLGFNWNFSPRQILSLGYGLHHQTQHYGFYYYKKQGTSEESNRDLKFTRSNQVVLGYDVSFAQGFRFKAETYYQQLSKVPVEQMASAYSILNYAATVGVNTYTSDLVNEGFGRNYGIELTFEKFFDKNYYLLLTASLFDSKYKGSDGILRNTAYNGKYVVNLLGGYERKLKHNLTFLINGKLTVAGGLPYTPIDEVASIANKTPIYETQNTNAIFNAMYLKPDIRWGIRKSFKRKIALEGSFDFQNIINRKNVYFQVFDKNTGTVNTVLQNGFFPTFQFRLEF